MATASATEIPSMTEIPSQDNNASMKSTDGEIDSALQSALRDPRERVALLRLETVFCDFMESDAGWLEVGGPFNSVVVSPVPSLSKPRQQVDGRQTSFQRCILHRLADRFGIVRENGSLLENSIRLIKMPDSCIPKVLLQNVEVPSDEKTDVQALTTALPGEMKIMKRSDSRKSTDSRSSTGSNKSSRKKNNNGKKSSLSDKEKAYAEARARIFSDNDESTNSLEATAAAVSEPPPPTTTTKTVLSSKAPSFSQSSRTQSSDSIGSDKKAVYRNRAEEAADPDFQRGAAAVVFQQPYYAAAAATYPASAAPMTGATPMSSAATPSTQYFVPSTAAYPQQQQSLQAAAPAFTPRQRVYSSDDVPRQRVYSDDPMRLPTETRK